MRNFKVAVMTSLISVLAAAQVAAGEPDGAPAEEAASDAAPTASDAAVLSALMDEARRSMVQEDYARAVQIYAKVLDTPGDHPYRRDAQELLGLARERNGQLAHAKAEYEEFLRRYPEGEAADRVRQRLAGLITAAWKPPQKLRLAEKPREAWNVFGSFSQYLRRDASNFEQQGEVVQQFGLVSLLDVNARRRTEAYDYRARFSGSYLYDLNGGATGNRAQLSVAYLDVSDRSRHWSGRLGRQSAYGSGVLGRFDGLNLGWQPRSRTTLNLVAGSPVERSTDLSPNTGRYFYGVSLDAGPWRDYWGLSGYLLQQQADGLLDRRAAGGELRYTHPQRQFYSLVDYDLSYASLNIFTAQGTWMLPDKTTLTFLVDYRNAPPLTTSNALIGQGADSLKELRALYTEEEIRALALDRTPHNYLAMIGAARQLTERFRIDADFTGSNLTPSAASGGVPDNPGTPNEYYFSSRLTGTNLISKSDVTMFGVRLAQTASTNSAAFTFNSRLPTGGDWHLNPRLRLDYRKYRDQDRSQWLVAPALRYDYRWRKRYLIELDGGMEWSRDQLWLGTQEYLGYYISAGYRAEF